MTAKEIWREDLLPLARQLINWIIGKPSSKLIMLGITLLVPGMAELILALISSIIQKYLGHSLSATTSNNGVDFSQVLGVIFMVTGLAMTLYEWWAPHSDKRNRDSISAAAGRIQDQQNLRNSYKSDTNADLQTKFQQAWGPINAIPQQIRHVLDYQADPGNAVSRFVRGIAFVKTKGNWFELKYKWIPVAYWIYFVLSIISLVVGTIILLITLVSLVPGHGIGALTPEKIWALSGLFMIGILCVISFKPFIDLSVEFRSAVDLSRMTPP